MDEGPSSFTIEFPFHLDEGKRDYCLNRLREDGGEVEVLSTTTFRIRCATVRDVENVGRSLYHTMISGCCKVVGVSGVAVNRASAYKWLTRAERRLFLRR